VCLAAHQATSYQASTGATFTYNTNRSSFEEAEALCNAQGGTHLAYYTSLAEQQEVETGLVALGVLFPGSAPSYWLGLRSDRAAWPKFRCAYRCQQLS
jgi:hypothetical protein